ncbi:isoflavone reductase family protein [Whalleya microplaca]|nr:isoflavone reductase family protein [Whalleya microplaca]
MLIKSDHAMAASPSVLIIGAGELGTAVLSALSAHPARQGGPLTVLLRASTIASPDPGKQARNAHLRSLGASLVAGDIASASVAELAPVFRGFHTVIACAGFGLPPRTQTKLARAVLEAGVPRYLPWQWGIDYDAVGAGSAQDLFDEQLEVRGILRSQTETDWVIVTTGLFMSFLFLRGFGVVDVKGRVVRALGAWDARLTVTEVRDIGRLAAEVVYVPGGIERRVVYIAGDTLSYARVAELVERRFGGEWKRELWDREVLRERLRADPGDGMAKYASVWAAGKGVAWDLEQTLNAQRGIQTQDVESYLQEMEV